MNISHYNYKKKQIVTLKVIICVEAHLYMMLHNEFQKIPNVISKSGREHNRITIKHEFRGEYHWLCIEIFLLIRWKVTKLMESPEACRCEL